MFDSPVEVAEASATGDVVSVAQPQILTLAWVSLTAAAADATVVVRETDGSGKILSRVSAKAGETEQEIVVTTVRPAAGGAGPVKVHATLSGAGAIVRVGYR